MCNMLNMNDVTRDNEAPQLVAKKQHASYWNTVDFMRRGAAHTGAMTHMYRESYLKG